MNTTTIERPCSVAESIIQSCKEVKLIREGKLPKKNINQLWDELDIYLESEDDENEVWRFVYRTVWEGFVLLR